MMYALQLLCGLSPDQFLAKIAVALKQALALRARNGSSGQATPQVLARGEGWSVSDVICTSGPRDSSFEERHSQVAIGLVAAGTFQYRCATGRELMTPGSFLLGNAGECFECGHEHAAGDRCISFQYTAEYFEGLTGAAIDARRAFGVARLPPQSSLSPLVVRACAGLNDAATAPWEDLSVTFAGRVMDLVTGRAPGPGNGLPGAVARVTKVARMIEDNLSAALDLSFLAREARLSPYHFLRLFEYITGATPHQYVVRARLHEAALRLLEPRSNRTKILDIALDCGFGDVSNFNRSFRAKFGVSPRAYRGR